MSRPKKLILSEGRSLKISFLSGARFRAMRLKSNFPRDVGQLLALYRIENFVAFANAARPNTTPINAPKLLAAKSTN